jgi:4-diphosphocytidyl-2-C-methyl-D-erythritol kinase
MIISSNAPAKINYCLRIIQRRPDGYHELNSIFLPLALADTLEINIKPDVPTDVTCYCPGHPDLDGPTNLAARAALAYLHRSGLTAQVDIRIEKNIWSAAGLGGGSSDAAAVLLALYQSFHGLTAEDLFQTAKQLGADVPYFLDPRPKLAYGIGDDLRPISGWPTLHLVLLNPGCPLSTAAVYAGLGLAKGENLSSPLEYIHDGSRLLTWPNDLLPLLQNDLAGPAERLCPTIIEMKQALLNAGALATSVTGSGPTTFGIFTDSSAAQTAAKHLLNTTTFLVLTTCTVFA